MLEYFIEMEKAHIKNYTKHTKSGKLVNVKEHEDKRKKKEQIKKKRSDIKTS